jgi:hypothetical protein
MMMMAVTHCVRLVFLSWSTTTVIFASDTAVRTHPYHEDDMNHLAYDEGYFHDPKYRSRHDVLEET